MCKLSFHKYAWSVVLHKDILTHSLISLHYDWGFGWFSVHRMSRCVQQLLVVHLKPRILQRLKAECYWLRSRSAEEHIQCPAAAHTDAETVIKYCSAPLALNPLSAWQPCNCFHLQTLCQVTDLGSGSCQVSLSLCLGGFIWLLSSCVMPEKSVHFDASVVLRHALLRCRWERSIYV